MYTPQIDARRITRPILLNKLCPKKASLHKIVIVDTPRNGTRAENGFELAGKSAHPAQSTRKEQHHLLEIRAACVVWVERCWVLITGTDEDDFRW